MFDKLFKPKSVAIIGASQKALSIGNVITKNLLKYEYKGPIYPINPKADEILGVKAYPSILDVPGEIDLAHISIPAKFSPQAIDECGKKGVKFVIINSAGFREIGEEGEAIENEVVARAKSYGIRVFGPNCQGIINTDPEIKAYCDFTFTYPEPGYVSIVAQSGGVGAVYMQSIHDLGVGMRFYASNGNACDISIPEILRYYGDDERTRVIILYAEGFADPKEFMEAAEEVAAKKPILGMRAGRTEEGAKAAVSHTGGLAGVGLSTELIFKKTGILTFRDVEEMCQSAMAFASQPIPKGNSVGLITDTGGPAIIATDELVDNGLKIPELSEDSKKILKETLYPEAAINNPVDVLAERYTDAWVPLVEALDSWDEPDILLWQISPEIEPIREEVVRQYMIDTRSRMMQAFSRAKKPKAVVVHAVESGPGLQSLDTLRKMCEEQRIAFYPSLYRAARAISSYLGYHQKNTRQDSRS